jgi:hypothetical protein
MTIQLSQIELGNVVPGAVPLAPDEKGFNESFIGHIDAPSGRHKAYIKVLSGKQLVNELVAVTVGRAINLPIPPGYLLRVRPSDLPDSQLLKQYGKEEALIFGSRALNHPTLARRFSKNMPDAVTWLRTNFGRWDEATIFDDWIANADRHPGNLIVGGANQTWLIDHSHCFTGPDWQASHLQKNQTYKNQLAEVYIPSLTLPQRVALKDKTGVMANLFSAVNSDVAMSSSYADKLLSSIDLDALTNFLRSRVPHLMEIMSNRVGIPGLGGVQ